MPNWIYNPIFNHVISNVSSSISFESFKFGNNQTEGPSTKGLTAWLLSKLHGIKQLKMTTQTERFLESSCKHCKAAMLVPGVPKRVLRLINNRTKGFCLIFKISFVLDKVCPKLDFEIKIVEVCWKLSEICYSEVEHRFYKPNFGDFWLVNLLNFCKA